LEPHDSQSAQWFAQEVLPHEPQLRSWLQARFLAASDVDDVVQEAYARLWRARATGGIACPRAFVFVTARNLALNRLRHERLERPPGTSEIDALALLDERTSIPDSIAQAEDLKLLLEAIQSLPERCRQIVTLRKIYGLSQKEVAARLGISEATVETQGTIGLRKCTDYFRRHGYLKGRS
jgi:RNA polymerase sigma-70 factor (ECF subfamily)